MTESKHTPGPWSFDLDGDPPYNHGWMSGDGKIIAGLMLPTRDGERQYDEMKANAELIARAPEMAEEIARMRWSLAQCAAELSRLGMQTFHGPYLCDRMKSLANIAREAAGQPRCADD